MLKKSVVIPFVLMLSFIINLLPANAAFPSAATVGFRDAMLIFDWENPTQNMFYSSVAHVDKNGQPDDWFFDAFLFLRSAEYVNGVTNKTQWQAVIDKFVQTELPTLKAAIDQAKQTLGNRPQPVKIIQFIPYTSPSQTNFGDVDGDGVSENFSILEDRRKAIAWYVDTIKSRFEALGYSDMVLWGFYWCGESIYNQADIDSIKKASGEVHRIGKKILWIPWNGAPNVDIWQEFGLDIVTIQPNYTFTGPPVETREHSIQNEDRLTMTANRARDLGLGLEIEPWGLSHPTYRSASQLYLEHGVIDGYQNTVHTHLRAALIHDLCSDLNPSIRLYYDSLYQFTKGLYQRRGFHQPLPIPTTSQGSQAGSLVDGIWNTSVTTAFPGISFTAASNTITFNLGAGRLLSDIRVHFKAGKSPRNISVSLSPDATGETFKEVAAIGNVMLRPEHGGGFGILNFPATFAKRMTITLDADYGTVNIDEILALPTSSLLWGETYTAVGSTGNDGMKLTDGIPGDGNDTVWTGTGSVVFNIPSTEKPFAGTLWVHFNKRVTAFSPGVTINYNGKTKTATASVSNNEAWAQIPINEIIGDLTVDVYDSSAGSVAIDEISLTRGNNLAFGRPYALTPTFPSTIPNDGLKLTDGQTADPVGWYNDDLDWPTFAYPSFASVTVDTGAIRQIDSVATYLLLKVPQAITVSVSDDKVNWKPEKVFSAGAMSTTVNQSGRYVKFTFWLDPGWLKLTELYVYSGGQNVAQNKIYDAWPKPSYQIYAAESDNTGKLTDGFYGDKKSSSNWSVVTQYIPYTNEDPEIVAILAKDSQIKGARVHLPGGTEFVTLPPPRKLTVWTSMDAWTWTLAGEVSNVPAGTQFMEVNFAARTAKYVKYKLIRPDTDSSIYIDEIEVIPAL